MTSIDDVKFNDFHAVCGISEIFLIWPTSCIYHVSLKISPLFNNWHTIINNWFQYSAAFYAKFSMKYITRFFAFKLTAGSPLYWIALVNFSHPQFYFVHAYLLLNYNSTFTNDLLVIRGWFIRGAGPRSTSRPTF